jgi:hypothetical protein
MMTEANYFPSPLMIFTGSPWTNSLPQITWPVFSGRLSRRRSARVRYTRIAEVLLHSNETTLCANSGSL